MRILVALLPLIACGTEADLDIDASSTSTAQELRTNDDPNRIVVYSNNIENMLFDWKDLVHHMEEAPLRPDVFLVQQVSSKAELMRLIGFMEERLGVEYGGLVAQDVPEDHRFHHDVDPRPRVTTGVIYRKARFAEVTRDSWMPFGRGFPDQRKTCDERSNHSGYETLRVKLHDKQADQDIVVASLRHWTWNPCSSKNLRALVEGEEGGANDHAGMGTKSALHIVAGDFNDRPTNADGSYKCWYRSMNRSVGAGDCASDEDWGFVDPLYVSCDGSRSCVKNKGGIDSLFVRRSDGRAARTDHFQIITFAAAHRASVDATGGDGRSNREGTVGWNDVSGNYSQHKARRAYVYYN